jgi:6-phosphogluconolactonase
MAMVSQALGERRPARGRKSVVVHSDPEALALATAAMIVTEARRAVKKTGRFTLALAGGQTPKTTYELLAAAPFADLMPWAATHVFWGDERCVDPSDPRSNERLVREALLDHVPVPAHQVHPMRCSPVEISAGPSGEAGGQRGGPRAGFAARRAAREYEQLLRAFFSPAGPPDAGRPGLDLVLLGLGRDGHTASLLPGTEALGARGRWVAAAFGAAAAAFGPVAADGSDKAREPTWRVTLTAPFINRAALVVFIATGAGKAEAVREAVEGRGDRRSLPARLIRPADGRLVWFLDDDSASLLGGRRSC